MRGKGQIPNRAELAKARSITGMHWVELDPANRTVRFAREGVMLDLGAIGKGYAIEQAAEGLREAGVTSALLHGGTSTVVAIGRPPESPAWNVEIEYPEGPSFPSTMIAVVPLIDKAMSVSAVWGKSFQAGGKTYGHVIDPRSGQPASRGVLAAVALPSATETDALSTALLVEGPKGQKQIASLRDCMGALVVEKVKARNSFRVHSSGI